MPNYLMHYFIFSPAMYEDSNFSTSSPVLVILYIKKITVILVDVKWYLIMISICVSLIMLSIYLFM